MDDFVFDIETTVPLMLDYTDWITDFDVIAEVRVVTEFGDRWWEVTTWRYRGNDGSIKSLSTGSDTHPKKWLYACCEAHAKDSSFKQMIEDEIVSKCGRLPDPNAEHRHSQREFV